MNSQTCEWCGNSMPCVNPYNEEEHEYDMYEIAHTDPSEIFYPQGKEEADEELLREADKAYDEREHTATSKPGSPVTAEGRGGWRGKSIVWDAVDWSM